MRTLREIADEVDRIVHAFPVRDSRRDDVRALAAEIREHAPKFGAAPLVLYTEATQCAKYPSGTRVYLSRNDEAGRWKWLVESAETGYGIWSYPTKRAAVAACKRYGWKAGRHHDR